MTDLVETTEATEDVTVEPARKMPIKVRTIHLHGEYEGWWFEARTNPKLSAFSDVASGDFDRMVGGLSKIIRRWNFVDEEGLPLPQPNDGGTGDLSLDLLNFVSSAYVEELGKLPPPSGQR